MHCFIKAENARVSDARVMTHKFLEDQKFRLAIKQTELSISNFSISNLKIIRSNDFQVSSVEKRIPDTDRSRSR